MRNMTIHACDILAVCSIQPETAYGGSYFILDSRLRGNDNGTVHLSKVLHML